MSVGGEKGKQRKAWIDVQWEDTDEVGRGSGTWYRSAITLNTTDAGRLFDRGRKELKQRAAARRNGSPGLDFHRWRLLSRSQHAADLQADCKPTSISNAM